jgi:hypothetical protein
MSSPAPKTSVPSTPVRVPLGPSLPRAPGPLLSDILVRQARIQGLEYLTPFEVDTEAWRLSVLGFSVWRVKAALGLPDLDAVTQCLTRYRESDTLPDDLKRALMIGQLDDAISAVIGVRNTPHYKFHKGSLMTMPEDPSDPDSGHVPVVDTGPTLDAAKTLAMLLERKAKLGGWDAPERHEHTITPLPAAAATWVESKRLQAIEGTNT